MTAPIRPRVKDDLFVVELDGEAVIYDDQSGSLHLLNPTATVVLSLFDGTATIRELAADIGHAYGMPAPDIERQVRSLLRQFRKQGLMDGKAGTDG